MIIGFTTAFAVLHLVTLTIKDGSLHRSNHFVQSRGKRFLILYSKLLRDKNVHVNDANKLHRNKTKKLASQVNEDKVMPPETMSPCWESS